MIINNLAVLLKIGKSGIDVVQDMCFLNALAIRSGLDRPTRHFIDLPNRQKEQESQSEMSWGLGLLEQQIRHPDQIAI